MILKDVSIYEESANEEESTAKIPLIIAKLDLFLTLYFSCDWILHLPFLSYGKEKRTNEEVALKKPASKSPDAKKSDTKTLDMKDAGPIAKKVDEIKPSKSKILVVPTVQTSSSFFSDDNLRIAEDELTFHAAEHAIDSFDEGSAPTITHPQIQHRLYIFEGTATFGFVTISQGQTTGISTEAIHQEQGHQVTFEDL